MYKCKTVQFTEIFIIESYSRGTSRGTSYHQNQKSKFCIKQYLSNTYALLF